MKAASNKRKYIEYFEKFYKSEKNGIACDNILQFHYRRNFPNQQIVKNKKSYF